VQTNYGRVLGVRADGAVVVVPPDDPGVWPYVAVYREEVLTLRLNDPATMGCLLALVREAWIDETIVVQHDRTRGAMAYRLANWADDLPVVLSRRDVPSVLVAALEAAPKGAE